MRPFADGLIALQRDDGGWGQLPTLPSDAWATGTGLLALFKGGIATSHPAYQLGVNYLLRTQFDDGSWWVRSRSWPIQPHFDSKFPHGRDQWISAGGTAFAAIALLHTLEPTVRRETLPDAHSLIAPFTRSKSEVVKRDAASVPDSAEQSPATVPALTFTRDIKSLVERSCSGCHVGKKIKGGLSFATRASLLKGGESGEPAIVPGHSSESLLLRYVSDEIEDLEMPPLARREKYPALSAEEISLFRQWIDSGAVWDVAEATGSQ